MKKKVFSGIQPSGQIHLGNYLGAIQNWVKSQDEFDNIFCIVDLHAITVPQDPQELKDNIYKMAAIFLAAGIDPKKSTLFIQSHISAHSELAWLLNCLTPMGWLKRMTQFKEKSQDKKDEVSIGLFDYPVLMTADIFLYNTEVVPVGEDQKQHVELARDIAKRFNSQYGQTFVVPEARIPKTGARLMGLQNPEKKMSKSQGGEGNVVFLLDSPEVIQKKIMSATTDSQKEIVFDPNRPGVNNLLTIYQSLSQKSTQDIEAEFKDKGYADLKSRVAESVINTLRPIQEKYQEIIQDQSLLETTLQEGRAKIEKTAQQKLKEVREKIGLR